MHNIYKISGNPEGFEDLDVFHKLAQQFLPYAQEKLRFDKPVDIQLMSDPNNAKDPLGKTAYYDPNSMKVTLFVDKRHVKDILRSLAHELVHHKQNCRGDFDGSIDTSPGYAQEDGKMRKLEGEAYLEGSGYLFRDWEDTLKKENKVMSNLNENKAALRAAKKELKAAVKAAGVSSYKELPTSHPARKAFRVAYKAVRSGKQSPESIAQVGDMDKLAKGLSKTVAKSKQPPKKRSFQDITGVSMDDLKGAADRAGDVVAKSQQAPKKRSFQDITGVSMDDLKGAADRAGSVVNRAKGRKAAQDMFAATDDVVPTSRMAMKEGEKPDFLDLDKDGDKEESMKDAAKSKKEDETVDEGKDKPCPKCKKVKHEAHCPGAGKRDDEKDIDEAHCPGKRDDEKEETNENWFHGDKNQVLFERLVKKWAK